MDAVLNRVVSLQANISMHVELAQCRVDVEKKFNGALKAMNDAMSAAQELQDSEKGAHYQRTMEVCNLIKAVEIDKDEDKKDKDKDKDKKKKDKETEEQSQESEVDRLKKLKKHQGKQKGPKHVLEK